MATSNQFYLNCLQEPVQELTEHELGSVQSDLDSDGISIISDCDSLTDFAENEKLSREMVAQESDVEKIESASKLPSGIKIYCNGVLIGTVLLAVSSIFLGQYFNTVEQIEEDLSIYNEEFSNELKEKVPEKIKDFKEYYDVPTALTYCQQRHKSDDIFMEHNVKKCLSKIEKRIKRKEESALKDEQMKKLKKYLEIKKQFLEEKEKFLIKREYKLLKAEMKLKHKNLKKNKNEAREDKPQLNKNADKTSGFNKVEKLDKDPVVNLIKKDNFYKEKKHKDIGIKSNRDSSMKYPKNYNKKQFKEYNGNKKLRLKKEKTSNKLNKNENKIKNIKLQTPKQNTETKNTREIDSSQFSSNNKEDKAKQKKTKSSTNYIVLESNNGNRTINGYWLGRLYKGRSELRNKRHSGDWYFDRASYRKTRRDKAKWYFDWMMDREVLRYKRSFYM